ncbi:hypothetical protein CBS147332_6276 [Penicillium roqueforti]|nr:hypothetical protein CBS147332_6276 [Penicillium roqueforti]KAI3098667.1 hypothetical protein CBS147331_8741 [Penicillium roqueforti]
MWADPKKIEGENRTVRVRWNVGRETCELGANIYMKGKKRNEWQKMIHRENMQGFGPNIQSTVVPSILDLARS